MVYLFPLNQLGGHGASHQELILQDHVCSLPPAMSVEELRITVTVALRAVVPGSTLFPGHNPFSSSSMTVLTVPRECSFWEKDVCDMWRRKVQRYQDWEENQNLQQHFLISKDTFWYLSHTYGKYLEEETTHLRQAISHTKRLVIVLHWQTQASSLAQIAAHVCCWEDKVVAVVNQGIDVLCMKRL